MNINTPVALQELTNIHFHNNLSRFELDPMVNNIIHKQTVMLAPAVSSSIPAATNALNFENQNLSASSHQVFAQKDDFSFMSQSPSPYCSNTAQIQSQMGKLQKGVDNMKVFYRPTSNKADLSRTKLEKKNECPKKKSTSSFTSESMSRSSSQATIVRKSPRPKPKRTEGNQRISFSNVNKLPLRLPDPPITCISNPHKNLPGHLRRHGLLLEANNFAEAKGITVEFALHMLSNCNGPYGPDSLLKSTSWFTDTFQTSLHQQLSQAQAANKALPRHFNVPTTDLSMTDRSMPTHILAIHGNQEGGERENGILIPCHAMLYILQCVSLPRFGESNSKSLEDVSDDGTKQFFPVVPIVVPRPKEFTILHRFIYIRNAATLLMDLLPIKQIAMYANRHQGNTEYNTNTSNSFGDMDFSSMFANTIIRFDQLYPLLPTNNGPKTAANHAVEELSNLTVNELFATAYRINSVWANGVAIGLVDTKFWSTLQKAWSLILAALGTKKGRYIDAESRGLNMGLKKFSE